MKKRLAIAVAIVLLWDFGGAWQALHSREPGNQEKPVSLWLKGFELNAPAAGPTFNEAVESVRHAGTNALPTLLNLLRARDSDLKHRVIALARKQHLIRID